MTEDLIRLLADARSHLPQTGKAYGVFLAAGFRMPQTLIKEQCIFPGKVRACSPCCLPLWGTGAPGKQSVELVSAEGGRQPVLPSPRTGKVAAKPPDEVLPAALCAAFLKRSIS